MSDARSVSDEGPPPVMQTRKPASGVRTLLFASLACMASLALAHFILIRPLIAGHWLGDPTTHDDSKELMVVWLMYIILPCVAPYIILLRSPLLWELPPIGRAGILLLISGAFSIGVLIIVFMVCSAIAMGAMSRGAAP